MTVGDAFLFNLAVTDDQHIYFVAYTDGIPVSKVVLFNFTSYRPGKCDDTCIVKPYEYKQLSRDSVVFYQRGSIIEGEKIHELRKSRIGKKLDPIPPLVMKKIKAGALSSKFTPIKIKELFRPKIS
jgi:hypothetical protein